MIAHDSLEIRILQEKDAGAFFEVLEKNRARLKQWVPWLDLVATSQDATLFIQNALAGMEKNAEVTLGIWLQDQFIGTVGINNWNALNRTALLGYWISEEFEGQGIATQCCRTFCQYCFEHLGINRIELKCACHNVRSEAIAKRLGFTFEGISFQAEYLYGVFVDQKVYALVKNQSTDLSAYQQ